MFPVTVVALKLQNPVVGTLLRNDQSLCYYLLLFIFKLGLNRGDSVSELGLCPSK